MKEIVVRIKDAVKMKEGRRAVNGVCMEVGSGELVAVQGKSGSGKTTLFRLLAGIDKPDAGWVEVLGEPLSELSEEARAVFRRNRLGLLEQRPAFLPELSVMENLALPLWLRGIPKKEREKAIHEAMAAVGAPAILEARPEKLSWAERRLAALARTLAGNPQVLLADEFLGDCPEREGEAMWDSLLDIVRRTGQTLIYFTTDMPLAAQAERCCVLRDGKLTEVTL
ncbi:ATP-binding cassette domain-containing protein [Christensenellaceae bacterium NSJ-63]|uniref:ATP-binding cassette domain-containing protein n=1 Tax=Guopingia tenuis TaxID=2763656 RepID=A0A926HXC9_9FIRM|nr:ATP-binding cassette domain-containing protein [Guopingia tenuis]MBC8539238.1 ATP-binding cassette domain-containing protein [Guopingia tenuis]